ncbi:hypothetical protein M3Y99_00210800 [Aphelenchoides fujianensis]|nr:hypothetical protein M3Y99_00210800 [Aphelenchoides fujianensis]
MNSSEGGSEGPKMTPVSLLEVGCQKALGGHPQKQFFETQEGHHGVRLIVGGFVGEGVAANRKASHHLAAKNVLLKIVDAGRAADFLIPGVTKAHARDHINSLMGDWGLDEELSTQNWPGKCDELCAQKKIPRRPEYTFTEEGPSNQKRFVCLCRLRDLEVQESGPSKKKAKAAAARGMHQKISELNEPSALPECTSVQLEKQTTEKADEDEADGNAQQTAGHLQSLLSARSIRKHSELHKCVGSERILRQLHSLPALEKFWPNRRLVFLLDGVNLVDLAEQNVDALQKQLDASMMVDEVRVFLEIRNAKTNKLVNFFQAVGSSIGDARELVCCRAVSFAQAKLGFLSIES